METRESKVDFWIITYKNISKVPDLLNSFRACTLPYTVHIFDNSCDPNVEKEIRDLTLPGEMLHVSSENLFCCKASQLLLQLSSSPYIAYLCVAHTEVNDPTWILDAVSVLESDPKIALAGHVRGMSGLYYYQSIATGQPSEQKPIPDFLPLLEGHFSRTEIIEGADHHIHVQGGAWVARREALLACGGFETKIKHLFMDVELAVRLQCYGWKLAQVPSMYSEYWGGNATPNHKDFKLAHVYHT